MDTRKMSALAIVLVALSLQSAIAETTSKPSTESVNKPSTESIAKPSTESIAKPIGTEPGASQTFGNLRVSYSEKALTISELNSGLSLCGLKTKKKKDNLIVYVTESFSKSANSEAVHNEVIQIPPDVNRVLLGHKGTQIWSR